MSWANGAVALVLIERQTLPKLTVEQREMFRDVMRTPSTLVEIAHKGFDDDRRELFEIPEVCNWYADLLAKMPQVLKVMTPSTKGNARACMGRVMLRDAKTGAREVQFGADWVKACIQVGVVF